MALAAAQSGCTKQDADHGQGAPARAPVADSPADEAGTPPPIKRRDELKISPRPPGLDAALAEHGKSPIEPGFEPATCDPKAYRVHEMPGYGKFYIEPDTQDVIKKQLLEGVAWEPHLQPLFEKYVLPGSTVIDVGAHIGTHAIKLGQLVGPKGHVIAFEPQRKMFDELRCNLGLNGVENVTPLQVGLGDTFGELEMDAPNPLNEGGVGPGEGGNRAPLRPLDSYALENVSVLKIDVEGFEDHVIEGARNTIAEHKPVIFVEIQGGKNWDNAPPEVREKIAATAHRLTSMGYRVDRVGVFDYLAQVEGSPPPPGAGGKGHGQAPAPTN